jgi:hypothetical protein
MEHKVAVTQYKKEDLLNLFLVKQLSARLKEDSRSRPKGARAHPILPTQPFLVHKQEKSELSTTLKNKMFGRRSFKTKPVHPSRITLRKFLLHGKQKKGI